MNPIHITAAFLIGMAVGYALKKSFKILIFLLGILLAVLFLLQSKGVIEIHTLRLDDTVQSLLRSIQSIFETLRDALSRHPSEGVSTSAGFAYGLKKG